MPLLVLSQTFVVHHSLLKILNYSASSVNVTIVSNNSVQRQKVDSDTPAASCRGLDFCRRRSGRVSIVGMLSPGAAQWALDRISASFFILFYLF